MHSLSVYVVANYPSFAGPTFFKQLEKLARGKVACVQLRDNQNELPHVLATAAQIKKILGTIPLSINTRHALQVAQTVGAAGVYLEGNTSYPEARRILGPHSCIGMPVRTMEEVIAAEKLDVNYLSVKVFPSKKTCPIVAIGGIDLCLVDPIYAELQPDDGIAMAGELMDVLNPYDTVQQMRALYEQRFSCGFGTRA